MEDGDPGGGWWKWYLKAERRILEERRRGQLAGALGAPLRSGSSEELRLMAREDERKAEEGPVELLEDGEFLYERLEELAPRDLPASRLEAEDARTSWLVERAKERAAQQLGDARNGRATRDRALAGGRPVKQPVREGDVHRCAACGHEPFVIHAPPAPDVLSGVDYCGTRMGMVDHGSPMMARDDGGLK